VRLFLVRHAHADDGSPDELRRLSADGRRQASDLGRRFADVDLDAVLTSPLLRARQTAEAIGRAAGAPIRVDERLAPGATVDEVTEAAREAGGAVAAVGHQPDCGEIAAAVTGTDHAFPPGGMVELELP
jgi:phosphohistidine phosphatase